MREWKALVWGGVIVIFELTFFVCSASRSPVEVLCTAAALARQADAAAVVSLRIATYQRSAASA